VDFHYAQPLKTADNVMVFKQVVRAVATRNGLHASFMPKPLAAQAGSGLHVNLSLTQEGANLFAGELLPDSTAGHFMAGILAHVRELTAFTNPLPNSYTRFGSCEAPRYVSWSRQNRSQLVRIPAVSGASCRMELRSPDPACNPYLAIALILAAGLDGIENHLPLPAPVNKNLFVPEAAAGLASLPLTLEDAVAAARESELVRRILPEGLTNRYFAEQERRCAENRAAANPDEFERERYFTAI
jgi:glutamine synthetase